MDSIAGIRTDYRMQTLSEEDTAASPFTQFENWWQHALHSDIHEVNAMTLATADAGGQPSARIVLLKGFNENGFIFYTNYESRKSHELETNNKAALVFFWKELERQVRAEGIVKKISAAESDAYFQSRPHDSQVGAWASPQSSIIADRKLLNDNVAAVSKRFEGKEIERPPFWGGYIVQPHSVEFWQGRSNRLHDRIRYSLQENNWRKERIAP